MPAPARVDPHPRHCWFFRRAGVVEHLFGVRWAHLARLDRDTLSIVCTVPGSPAGAASNPPPKGGKRAAKTVIDKCGQALKGVWWMSWHREATKDVVACDKLREAGKRALIRRFLNEETQPGLLPVTAR